MFHITKNHPLRAAVLTLGKAEHTPIQEKLNRSRITPHRLHDTCLAAWCDADGMQHIDRVCAKHMSVQVVEYRAVSPDRLAARRPYGVTGEGRCRRQETNNFEIRRQ